MSTAISKNVYIVIDYSAGAAYLNLKNIEPGEVVLTTSGHNDIKLDFDKDGCLLGIEFLNLAALHPHLKTPVWKTSEAWSDINSAPKDGSRILALVPERQFYRNTDTPNKLHPVVVRWVGEYQGWSMPGISGFLPTLWQPIRLPSGEPQS